MKRKKIFSGLVLFAMVMSITACAMGKDDTSEVQIMQTESISTEKGNDEQKETTSHDTQNSEMQDNENQATEMQQSEKQEPQQLETRESQQQVQDEADADLEERLAQYREEREGMTNVAMGNGVSGYGAPNADNFGFQADTADYMQNFDSRELNKAYETAKKYVTERKQSGNGLFLIVLMILLAILTSCIRNMKAELEEMQIMLKRIEVLQYGNCVARSRKRWAFNEIEQQIKKIWTYER